MTDAPVFPDSLCHRCAHLRVVHSGRGSMFLMCREPSLPKYTAQPVRACRGFTPASPRSGRSDPDGS
ncbi:MAG TPA: hypothetical protein VFD36_32610 [Kofleriaceae bacterium]|nr:hypothetical protein [Kofleriaceae bacterium]